MRTFVSTTFLLARAAEISVRQWLSLVGQFVGPELERRRVCVPFLHAWGACPANFACLYTMQGILDKLTHYDHGASAVNRALYSMQDTSQGTHAICICIDRSMRSTSSISRLCVCVRVCVCMCESEWVCGCFLV